MDSRGAEPDAGADAGTAGRERGRGGGGEVDLVAALIGEGWGVAPPAGLWAQPLEEEPVAPPLALAGDAGLISPPPWLDDP